MTTPAGTQFTIRKLLFRARLPGSGAAGRRSCRGSVPSANPYSIRGTC
jgi:hypothetical protein